MKQLKLINNMLPIVIPILMDKHFVAFVLENFKSKKLQYLNSFYDENDKK